MNGQAVTAAYLLGISEGRALLRQIERDGIAERDTFRAALANVEARLGQGFSGDTGDTLRGERDFWRARLAREGKAAS